MSMMVNLADELFEAYRRRAQYGDAYIHQKLKLKGLGYGEAPAAGGRDHGGRPPAKEVGHEPEAAGQISKVSLLSPAKGFSHDAVMTVMHEMNFEETEERTKGAVKK